MTDVLYLDYLNQHWFQGGQLLHGGDQVLEITVWGRLFTEFDWSQKEVAIWWKQSLRNFGKIRDDK
jgi:hypothetical protein